MDPDATASIEAQLALLVASLDGLQKTRLLAVASTALFAYDHFLNIGREVSTSFNSSISRYLLILAYAYQVEYFWSGKWNLTRILYFVVSGVAQSTRGLF